MDRILLFLIALLLLANCRNGENEQRVTKYRSSNASDLIRNPIQSDGTIDSSNLARIEFDHTSYDFGIIDQGDTIRHVFEFENKGNIPLLISDVRSTCGCTVPQWPKDQIQPGASETIEVLFDSSTKEGNQNKAITVYSNTIPNETKLYLKGYVQTAED